jgi:hypothetical protein
VDGRPVPGRRTGLRSQVYWTVAAALALTLLCAVVLAVVSSRTEEPPGEDHKPPMQGLAMQQARPLTSADAGAFSARVVTTTWAELQPSPGGELTRNNAIDRELRATDAFNEQHPDTPVHLKLRVLAGIYAPEWAKTLGDFEPVPVTHVQTERPGTLGPFWSEEYVDAYAELQQLLAERYDDDPLVRDNAISGCMTVFAEPFQRDLTNFGSLFAQGYSVDADEDCLRRQVDAHLAWKHTHQSLALNPFRAWTEEAGELARERPDVGVTLSVAEYCREALGDLCTLSNNSIRSDYAALMLGEEDAATAFLAEYETLYATIRELGPSFSFQTAAPSRVGDLPATVEAAAAMGANAVEVPISYDVATMVSDNAALAANPTGQE